MNHKDLRPRCEVDAVIFGLFTMPVIGFCLAVAVILHLLFSERDA